VVLTLWVFPGYTYKRRPVELIWSDMFQTRNDAKAAEKQIKGWSRAKKEALIRVIGIVYRS
jgi:putative endonuclease